MLYLSSGLPTFIKVSNVEINIKTDFKTWIEYESIMLDNDIKSIEQIEKVLDLCLKDDIQLESLEELEELFNGLLWFYGCGKERKENKKDEDDKESNSKSSRMVYSYEHDWSYIYSAFRECYNINLFEENLHWWEFKALFESLNDKCLFSKILSYRSMSISSKMSKEEKKFYREMKKLYALPDMRSEEEKESSFARAMMASMKIE